MPPPRLVSLCLLAAVLAGCRTAPFGPLAGLERSLVFQPRPYPEGDWRPPDPGIEDAWFESADGTRLHGWYLPHARARAAVLYCHGNGGNVADWAPAAMALRRRADASVLVFDYRGYGRSEGTPTEQGILADARAARSWLARREGVSEGDIVLVGRSLGGAVAVDLAQDGARALVLESTFTSLRDVGAAHSPGVPAHWLMTMRLDSAAKIGRYRGPLLASHGNADRVVPYALGRKLFEAANEPKRFITFARRGHNDPPPDWYYDELAALLAGQDCSPPGSVGQVSNLPIRSSR